VWYRDQGDLVVVSGLDERVTFDDPDGMLEGLLGLLDDAGRTREELVSECLRRWPAITAEDVSAALAGLDSLGLVADADVDDGLSSAQRERFFSNLVFFDGYASLTRAGSHMQERLLDAHVVILGVGGAGSSVMMNLVGLGVGRFTLLDSDVVEARNFVRQFAYHEHDLGRAKVDAAADWIEQFNPSVSVRTVSRRIHGAHDIAPLLCQCDLVIAAVDEPVDRIDVWINEACVSAGVPFVRGGASRRQVRYWSVDPGRSACWACNLHQRVPLAVDVARARGAEAGAVARFEGPNSSTGPASSLVGSLVSLEAMRYLTQFAPPAAAAVEHTMDLPTGRSETRSWQRWEGCPLCARACRDQRSAAKPRATPATDA